MLISRLKAPAQGQAQAIFHTMRASVHCRIRKDKMTKSGLAAVYLQIRINSENTQLPLEISWPVEHFDNKKGEFLPRFKTDTMAADYNLLKTKQLGMVNEIFIYFRHSDQLLTVPRFHSEFHRFGLREDFIAWSIQNNEDRYAAHKIENQTYKNIKSQLKKVQAWKPSIPFGELSKDLLEGLHGWLRKTQNMSANGAWAILKTMKSQAMRAHEAGLHFDIESVQRYKLPTTQRRIVFLTAPELQKLWNYLLGTEITAAQYAVLRAFLFSTLTGLRFSDIERVTWKNILDDTLTLVPYKTRNTSKLLSIKIPEDAWFLIENKRGKLFNTVCQQTHNAILKEIALACGVRKNITTHVARHTFATESLRNGVPIQVLQLLMGHTKIGTTMIYVHVTASDQAAAMDRMKAPIPIPQKDRVIGRVRTVDLK